MLHPPPPPPNPKRLCKPWRSPKAQNPIKPRKGPYGQHIWNPKQTRHGTRTPDIRSSLQGRPRRASRGAEWSGHPLLRLPLGGILRVSEALMNLRRVSESGFRCMMGVYRAYTNSPVLSCVQALFGIGASRVYGFMCWFC